MAWSNKALDYFQAHAIDPDLTASFGVREEDGALVYPYPGFERRRPFDTNKTLQPKGTELQLWWPAGRKGNLVLLTEGEPDALAALSALQNLPEGAQLPHIDVAALPGASFSPGPESFPNGADVYLAMDGDEAGERALARLSELLMGYGLSVAPIELPHGQDLSDVLAGSEDPGHTLANLLVDAVCSVPEMPFRPLHELIADSPEEPEWVWEGYLAPGAITLLAGKPKVGKSTIICSFLDSLLRGDSFLDQRTRLRGKVLLLTEEREGTLGEKVRSWGLNDPNLLGEMRYRMSDLSWDEVVEKVRTANMGIELVVVDVWDKWTGLEGEQENSSGAQLQALKPLEELASDGVAVLIVAHQRKGKGSHGEAVRGTNALVGGVDVVVELERSDGATRKLNAISRYAATPAELTIALADDRYQVIHHAVW